MDASTYATEHQLKVYVSAPVAVPLNVRTQPVVVWLVTDIMIVACDPPPRVV